MGKSLLSQQLYQSMDQQTNDMTDQGNLGLFFPRPEPLPTPTKESLAGIKFRGKRVDLEVYHLVYGTKKLRACTYRRMEKRQNKINKRKAQLLLPKSPEQKVAKAEKEAFLRKVQEIVEKQKLVEPIVAVPVRRNAGGKKPKGAGKKKAKKIRKIKAKILAQKQAQMKD